VFRSDYRERAAKLGVDLEGSYREFLLDVRVGGPVYQRLCDGLDGRDRRNYESGTVSSVVQRSDGPTLSAREVEVLELYVNGRTAPEVARELSIGTEAVRDRTRRIRVKLGARNTTHAVAIAIREGLI
jgi:DNA-binding NarL/FixJ family response regulator